MTHLISPHLASLHFFPSNIVSSAAFVLNPISLRKVRREVKFSKIAISARAQTASDAERQSFCFRTTILAKLSKRDSSEEKIRCVILLISETLL